MNYKQLLEQLIDTFDGGDALQDLEGTDFASAKGLWIHLSGLYDDLLRGESLNEATGMLAHLRNIVIEHNALNETLED